ncbi:hypothetical protein [Caballeronia catudaia]|uniref:hypothetical protein n=1 Tax=Caballeronia catudaia TaxID=1777136 RepID=UPI00190EB73A|nr:hypothetical protein [Caballeronia catudaia]
MTEVDTGFQHLTHRDCHEILREGWVLSRLPHPTLLDDERGTPWVRRLAYRLEAAMKLTARLTVPLPSLG